jgi:DNA polymerase III epsilon subunit-like protein
MSHVCVIDIETTGLCPVECGVIEIGAVMLSPTLEFIADWSVDVAYVPQVDRWELGAQDVHGVTPSEARSYDRVVCYSAVYRLLDFIETFSDHKKIVFAGMNLAGFDLAFLKAIIRRAPVGWDSNRMQFLWDERISHRTIDLHAIMAAVTLAKGGDISKLYTDRIYEVLGMEAEPTPHRALTGARMEAEALRRAVAMLNGATPETLNPALDA